MKKTNKKSVKKVAKKAIKRSVKKVSKADKVRVIESKFGTEVKTVLKDNGAFIRVWPEKGNEDKMIRLHVYPDGHWNVQYKEQEGSKKVVAKGDIC